MISSLYKMERTKLLFDYEERSVGILVKNTDDDGNESEKYLRAFQFSGDCLYFRTKNQVSGIQV